MNKSILIINANMAAAQTIKHNLTSPNTEIVCVSSMHDALQTFINTEFCLIILDAGISAEDDHKLLKAMRKARTTPILILSSQSCHVERLTPISGSRIRWRNVLPRHNPLWSYTAH